jgi:DNA-binding response OmpR family regulator
LEKKRILIVEDDSDLLKSLKDLLEKEGYNVYTAETGHEAVKKSEECHPNLALLDIKLPDMEGIELLVKMHKNTPQMMKVMITGYPSLENAVKSLNLGADAYIIKPVNPGELLRVVEEKLKEQEDAEKMTEEKIKEWIETRARNLSENFIKRTST